MERGQGLRAAGRLRQGRLDPSENFQPQGALPFQSKGHVVLSGWYSDTRALDDPEKKSAKCANFHQVFHFLELLSLLAAH